MSDATHIRPTRRSVTSILKTAKYSQKPLPGRQPTGSQRQAAEQPRTPLSTQEEDGSSACSPQVDVAPVDSTSFVCKDLVVERDPTKPALQRKLKAHARKSKSHSAVEGYVPSLASSIPSNTSIATACSDRTGSVQTTDSGESGDTVASKNDDSSPLVLNSLEELFEAAGMNLPEQAPHKITADTKLVEADIAFSVMSHDEYNGKLAELREQHEEERKAQLRIFTGTEDIFDQDDNSTERDSSDDEDDDLLDMLMGAQINEDDYFDDVDQEEMERLPRPFRLLWETFSEWITPQAVDYLTFLKDSVANDSLDRKWREPVMERSDIEASRCAGLMAMVKLYLPKCLEELGFAQELRRTADMRLGELLRMFNYVQEAPKFPVKLWKAMTCILLAIVLAEHHNEQNEQITLPPCIKAIEMTMDEYRYLSRSAVKAFGVP